MPLFKAKHLHSCDRTFTRTLALFLRMFISRVADFATLAPSTAIATAGDHVVTLNTRTALGTTWALSGAIVVLLRCDACSLRPATVGASLVTRMAALLVIARHLLAMQHLKLVVAHYMMGFGHACVPLRAVLFPVNITIRVEFIGQVAKIARLETCIG